MTARSWAKLREGDVVQVRGKRRAHVELTTVDRLLDVHPSDGRGFMSADGTIYRHFYYDVEVVSDPYITSQIR